MLIRGLKSGRSLVLYLRRVTFDILPEMVLMSFLSVVWVVP